MMKLKDKMTPAELADCTGLARQTINRWVREKQWRTEAIPGVKGGERDWWLSTNRYASF